MHEPTRPSLTPEGGLLDSALSRRDILGGGLVLGAMLLTGCQARRSAELPGPHYPVSTTPNTPTLVMPTPAATRNQPVSGAPEVLSRSQWTRMGMARPRDAHPMGGVGRITIHHDAMPSLDIRSPAEAAQRLEAVRLGHVGKGWADIGYHYIIDPAGRIWEGRSVQYQGAHVEDNNEHNLGIMLMGNFDRHSPTSAALASLDRFVAQQMARYSVPLRRVFTHQEIRPTACPGRALQRYMVMTRGSGGAMSLAST